MDVYSSGTKGNFISNIYTTVNYISEYCHSHHIMYDTPHIARFYSIFLFYLESTASWAAYQICCGESLRAAQLLI